MRDRPGFFEQIHGPPATCSGVPDPLESVILVLGAPRSGTTWLAKIIDSHPDVLYRHEPDKGLPGPDPLTPDALPALLARWAGGHDPGSVTKRPFFAKSWQPAWAPRVRTVLAAGIAAAARMPRPLRALAPVRALADFSVPEFAARVAPRFAIKSINWTDGALVMARTLPDSRTILIMRHPCGQVASVMRGHREHRFDLRTEGTDMAFDEVRAMRLAATQGVDGVAFQALTDAAKCAWNWRAFNEPVYAALASLPNVTVVLYEALCARPEALVGRIMRFAGLDWNQQTADFVARSTAYRGKAGFYAVFRNAVAAAENWRKTMAPSDQEDVRMVASMSPLARLWPDLIETP